MMLPPINSVAAFSVFLVLVAVLGAVRTLALGIATVSVLVDGPSLGIALAIITLANAIFSAGYLYLGMHLRDLLRQSPEFVDRLLLGSFGVQVAAAVASAWAGSWPIGALIVSYVVTRYLRENCRRLYEEQLRTGGVEPVRYFFGAKK